MKNGLAIWHYPHRSVVENVEFFAKCGFQSVSVLGRHFYAMRDDEEALSELAVLVKKYDLILTMHHELPRNHLAESISDFKGFVAVVSSWQEKYGCISILSFDVWSDIRDNITPYIDYVLEKVEGCKIAVEDFGLNIKERSQIEYLKDNERFGYLVDIGHMHIRLCKKMKQSQDALNGGAECQEYSKPGFEEFLKAFKSKDFPIFEMHLHNNDGVSDLHYFLEDGILDIPVIAAVLREINFDGVLTIESAPGFKFKCQYPESDERIIKTYNYWKEVIFK